MKTDSKIETSDRTKEFQRKLRELVSEYGFDLEVDTGYYGDIDGIDFCLDGKRVVGVTISGNWDFDGNGFKSIEEIRKSRNTGGE